MEHVDNRVRKLELTFARITGGGAIAIAVMLGLFGYTTFYQVPKTVVDEIPQAVTDAIEKKYPDIESELSDRMIKIKQSKSARTTPQILWKH